IEVAGGSLYLDHTTFLTTTHQYVSLDNSSFVITGCYFPTTTAPFELLHGTGGIKAGGHGIVRECFFGSTSGYNDIMDFTGGNRDLGQPIIQYLNNVFVGASDDILDLDGTDAWIENNIFLHVHKNGAPDSSSAVSGGNNGSDTSEITIIGNLFFDCDQAATAKQGNFFTLLNNTIVRMTKTGGLDTEDGVVNVQDRVPSPPTTYAAGFYLEGNIVSDAAQLVRNYDPAQTTVTFNNNILPLAWAGPGSNNLVASPLLKYIPQVSETYFTNWQAAQVLRDWFSLQPGSPARRTGPNSQDKGGLVAHGASIAGPQGTNNQTTATLTVGTVRSGSGIPAAGFPAGSGYVAYKYRLDNGPWSAETPTTIPISLTGLANGPHRVDVTGKRDSGWYQDDPLFGPEALVTSSQTWVVDTAYVPPSMPTVRLNEILAQNSMTLTNDGTTPDLIELYNYGSAPVDLTGMGLTDSASKPYKFAFPAGTPSLNPGQYLVLYADSQTTAPGIHLGFNIKANGDDIYLHDSAAHGGGLLDSVVFGIQVPDLSIGRGVDGTWVLCQPTFGAANLALELGDPHQIKINEWLADELLFDNNDFVELFNPASLPVELGGCFMSDAEGAPARSPLPPLSFVAPSGFALFTADGNPGQGPDHLTFKLDPNAGIILLSDAALNIIDEITYGPQSIDVSQGRSPNGSDTIVSFLNPTPGGPNAAPNGIITVTNVTSSLVDLVDMNSSWRYDNSGGTNFGGTSAWYQPVYAPESTWPTGQGLFG
ncbi:MAG TPA: lamin tail domain-containing protein, partial [Verrucomicrobiae bacterium]|nr:lamin tail domain-containing protein [Verrucomicrobiae bacterium]